MKYAWRVIRGRHGEIARCPLANDRNLRLLAGTRATSPPTVPGSSRIAAWMASAVIGSRRGRTPIASWIALARVAAGGPIGGSPIHGLRTGPCPGRAQARSR